MPRRERRVAPGHQRPARTARLLYRHLRPTPLDAADAPDATADIGPAAAAHPTGVVTQRPA